MNMTERKFQACGPGVTPRFPSDLPHEQFRHWNLMREWCRQQGWGEDDVFINAVFEKPWYFRTKEQQVWFALRWL
jgi:hypothetical protein